MIFGAKLIYKEYICSHYFIVFALLTNRFNLLNFKTFFFPFRSASGTSAVAIDNKIEQAMVSKLYPFTFIYFPRK